MYFPEEPIERRLVWSYLWKGIIDYASFDVYYLPTVKLEKLWKKKLGVKQRLCMSQYIFIELVLFWQHSFLS